MYNSMNLTSMEATKMISVDTSKIVDNQPENGLAMANDQLWNSLQYRTNSNRLSVHSWQRLLGAEDVVAMGKELTNGIRSFNNEETDVILAYVMTL